MTKVLRVGLDAGPASLDIANKLGIKAIAIDGFNLLAMKDSDIELLASKNDVDICQIGMFGYNPLSTDIEEQKKQTQALMNVIPLAKKVGCPFITIGSGNYHPSGFGDFDQRNTTYEAINKLAKALEPILDIAASHEVSICIEPYLKNAINSADKFKALHKLTDSNPYLKANIDLTSLMDFSDYIASDKLNDAVTDGFSGHYGLVHIKDIGLKEGFHINLQLAPVGTSNVDWGRYLNNISEHIPENSYVILEHISDIEEASNTLNLIRNAALHYQIELN